MYQITTISPKCCTFKPYLALLFSDTIFCMSSKYLISRSIQTWMKAAFYERKEENENRDKYAINWGMILTSTQWNKERSLPFAFILCKRWWTSISIWSKFICSSVIQLQLWVNNTSSCILLLLCFWWQRIANTYILKVFSVW